MSEHAQVTQELWDIADRLRKTAQAYFAEDANKTIAQLLADWSAERERAVRLDILKRIPYRKENELGEFEESMESYVRHVATWRQERIAELEGRALAKPAEGKR